MLTLLLVPVAGAASPVPAAQVTGAARDDIPPAYLALYMQAGARFSIPWQVLAGIGRVESDHGRNPNCYRPNEAGAVGPMQFLPATFREYAWAAGAADPDILNPEHAIPAAAAMLAKNGAPGDLYTAIYAYNHADWYVALVLDWARRYGWR
ncbi:MAG TPA: transglycosylase SLT domain-containing protein [Candidatus Dormibacteraeota bacterium]